LTQILQILLFLLFRSQRTRSHLTLYILTSLPSLFLTLQLYIMGAPRYSPSGALTSAGDDLSQAGLTQYMQDVVYVTWTAQLFGLIWSKGWWLYAIIPAYAGYRLFGVASPYIFGNKKGSPVADARAQAQAAASKDGLSKRQQKMQARYEKGDKRYQMQQRQVPQ